MSEITSRQRARVMRMEREPEAFVPYIGHETEGVVLLDSGARLAMLGARGLSFETADQADIEAAHAALCLTLRNVADERLVIYTHLVRTLAGSDAVPGAQFRTAFGRDLDGAWHSRLIEGGRLYRNEMFVSVLLRPAELPGSALLRRVAGQSPKVRSDADEVSRLDDAVAQVQAGLSDFGLVRLGVAERGPQRVLFSEIGEALHLILTGQHEPVPVPNGRLSAAIYTDRVICGHDTIEIRHAGGTTWAAGVSLKEYPAQTWPGLFDALLVAPYRCVLTHSFAFLAKPAALDIMKRKQNKMLAANDKAASQIEALERAADDLQSGKFVMGTHHCSLVAFADHPRRLRDVAARAKRDIAGCGGVADRADLALEALYWGQLPGNARFRVRPGHVTSLNFAGMAGLHNYPPGPAEGYWGAPAMILRTSGGTAYRYHPHVGESGNTFITGMTRGGKTTAMAAILTMIRERHGAEIVVWDKDRGLEIWVRAMGGTYMRLRVGVPTGCAPLKALDGSNPADLSFLTELVKGMIRADSSYEVTPQDEAHVRQGLEQVMSLPVELRSFAELRAFLGRVDPKGAGARLAKWCRGGELGWVLDCDTDAVRFGGVTGFDMTSVLDHSLARGPLMAYLFHRSEQRADGRRLVRAVDEFWKALLDEAFAALVHDKLKTDGKKNVLNFLATQSARDALASPIAHTIVEQCPTQMHFYNPRADRADYVDGLKRTEAEFLAIKRDMLVSDRRFLLVQGEVSLLCDLNLAGHEDLVAVLSGKTGTLRLMDELIARHGERPDAWLPEFRARWREAERHVVQDGAMEHADA